MLTFSAGPVNASFRFAPLARFPCTFSSCQDRQVTKVLLDLLSLLCLVYVRSIVTINRFHSVVMQKSP